MKWEIEYSREADRFPQAEGIHADVNRQIADFLKRLRGEAVSIDGKNLKGIGKATSESGKADLESYFRSIPPPHIYTLRESIFEAMPIGESPLRPFRSLASLKPFSVQHAFRLLPRVSHSGTVLRPPSAPRALPFFL